MKHYVEDVREEQTKSTVIMFQKTKPPRDGQKIMRPGKTAKDKKSGAHARRIQNQITRAMEKQK